MSWKVLITAPVFDEVGQAALQRLRDAGMELVVADPLGPCGAEQLMRELPGIDAVLASPDQFSRQVLFSNAARDLKLISRWGVGYDSIDLEAATEAGVAVAYTPGFLDETVADFAFSLLLTVARRVSEADALMKRGEWRPLWGHDIAGKTLGIVGLGRIGQAVARRASGFQMRVLAYDVAPRSHAGVSFVSLDELLQESDFVSVHTALTAENRGMIGRNELRRMKSSAYLVNTARGPLVDEEELVEVLHEGRIAGAAVDVFSNEPLPQDHPLRQAPRLVLASHQSSFGRETGERVSAATVEAVLALSREEKPGLVVNEEVFKHPNLRVKLA